MFKIDEPIIKQLPVRIKAMYNLYGRTNDKCGNCKYLLRIRYQNTYFKCSRTKMSASNATDWRVGWQSCGLFERKEN